MRIGEGVAEFIPSTGGPLVVLLWGSGRHVPLNQLLPFRSAVAIKNAEPKCYHSNVFNLYRQLTSGPVLGALGPGLCSLLLLLSAAVWALGSGL